MIPTLGRVVHYTTSANQAGDPVTYAAIITQVRPHREFYEGQQIPQKEEHKVRVSLHVFCHENFNVGSLDLPDVNWSPEPKSGCWSWPPRV